MRTAVMAVVRAATLPLRKAAEEFTVTPVELEEDSEDCWHGVCFNCLAPLYIALKFLFLGLELLLAAATFGAAGALALSVGLCLGSPDQVIEMLLFLGVTEEELPQLCSSETGRPRTWRTLPRLLAMLHLLEAAPMTVIQAVVLYQSRQGPDGHAERASSFVWFSLIQSAWMETGKIAFTLRYGFSFSAFVRYM